MNGTGAASAISAVGALEDPQRRRLYDAMRAARRPLTREEAARAVDISRKLAAFHLDKLVGYGLLEVVDGPAPGPRAVGRAPKRYRPVRRAVAVSIPTRSFEELAGMLVEAATACEPAESPARTRARVAAERGRALGASAERGAIRGRLGPERALALVESVLAAAGFEPYRPVPGALRLSNCPFHPLAERAPELVCGMNLDYLGGLLAGLQVDSVEARLAPCPGECCVEISGAT